MSKRDEIAQRALELIRIESVTGREGPIADFVEAWALRHFRRQDVIRISNSLVVGRLGTSRPTVILAGHLDTVPPQQGEGSPRIEGDRLHGLGASDMKGALSVMMAIAEGAADASVNPIFVFYEKEEGPYQLSGLGALFEAVPHLKQAEFAIALEPTDGLVQVGCVGSLHAELIFRGQAAHSARPWQGKNAIHAAGELLCDLNASVRREVKIDGYSFFEVMSVTQAQGGSGRNVIPEAFEMNLNYRFAPGKTADEAILDVHQLVRGRCEVRVKDVASAGPVCTNNSNFQRLIALTGGVAQAKQAWTDVARFGEHGIAAVNCGPGETAQAHQRNESVSLEALETSFGILTAFLGHRA